MMAEKLGESESLVARMHHSISARSDATADYFPSEEESTLSLKRKKNKVLGSLRPVRLHHVLICPNVDRKRVEYWEFECSCGTRIITSWDYAIDLKTCGHEKWIPLGISDVELSYLAGLVDGEGCISLSPVKNSRTARTGYLARLSIGMCHESVADLPRRFLVGRVNLRHNKNSGWKSLWTWNVNATEMRRLLPSLLPFLCVKKPQCEAMIQYLKLSQRKGRGDALGDLLKQQYITIRRLNKRGPIDG